MTLEELLVADQSQAFTVLPDGRTIETQVLINDGLSLYHWNIQGQQPPDPTNFYWHWQLDTDAVLCEIGTELGIDAYELQWTAAVTA